ncbi:MAG: IS66 family transposase [Deltaproteobacteria bacterium]|jgi:hypothetical protein|nr:IS66 family transposase [Deltaproteobacteria bacterium]
MGPLNSQAKILTDPKSDVLTQSSSPCGGFFSHIPPTDRTARVLSTDPKPESSEERELRSKIKCLEEERDEYLNTVRELKIKNALLRNENDQWRQFSLFSESSRGKDPSFDIMGGSVTSNRPTEDLSQIIEQLKREITKLQSELLLEKLTSRATISSLEKSIEELKLELGKPRADSSNSGISPSKDISKSGKKHAKDGEDPNNPREKKRRGGKKGHAPHFRKLFSENEADEVRDHKLGDNESLCRKCGSQLQRDPNLDKTQCQFDIIPAQIIKIFNKTWGYKCPKCGKVHYAPVAPDIRRGRMLSPSFIVKIILMKNLYLMPLGKIQLFLKTEYGLEVSVSYISKLIIDTTAYLRGLYFQLLDNVKYEKILNIDETVFKCADKQLYSWAFIGSKIAAFKIGTREGSNLSSVLGDDYNGTFICDCYGPYISYAKSHINALIQLCLVHLSRDFKRCSDYVTNKEVSEFGKNGEQYVNEILELNKLWKKALHDSSPDALMYFERLKALEETLTELCVNAPESYGKSRGIKKRFTDYPSYYFEFLKNPDVEPSNNRAERGVRPLVLERKISYGSKGINGNHACEVLWTIRETAKLLGVDIEAFFTEAIANMFEGKDPPSLLNIGQPVEAKYIEQAKQERKELKAIAKALAKSEKAKQESAQPLGTTKASAKTETQPVNEKHDGQAETSPVSTKPESATSEEKPQPEPKSPKSIEKLKHKPRRIRKRKPKFWSKPSTSDTNKQPKAKPKKVSSSNMKRKEKVISDKPRIIPLNAETTHKEAPKTTSDSAAPTKEPNQPAKAGRHLKHHPRIIPPSKRSGKCLKPLEVAPGSQKRESGACPKGSQSYSSPKPGTSLTDQDRLSTSGHMMYPGAKGRGARRKTSNILPPLPQV